MKRHLEKSLSPNASDLNHEAYKDGCKHYNSENFSRAKHAFETALEYWPLDPQAWFALGNCYDELKKPNKAESCFRKALKYSSPEKESDAYYNLGNSLYDQGKFNQAIKCYEKVDKQSVVFQSAEKNLKRAKNELTS